MNRWISIATLVLMTAGCCRAVNAEAPKHVMMFDSGKEGYPRYRIPSLVVSTKGTLLAICEGRVDGGGFTGDINLVLKRSFDNGKSWQPLQTIADDGKNTLGNPCPVVDRKTGVIWLAMSRSLGGDEETEIVDQTSQGVTQVWIAKSTDDGATWSKPMDISATARGKNWTWYGAGPGVGIQLKTGRLVIPGYHAVAKTKIRHSHVMYSDDHGKTWKLGGSAGPSNGECQVAERADGSLYLNARTSRGLNFRTTVVSQDGGETWEKGVYDRTLHDSPCQGAVYRLTPQGKKERSRWLFSHPALPSRTDLTVRLSYDEGRTWPVSNLLRKGNGQYSSLALLPDRSIGCLYDLWQDGNYRLYFTRFSLSWLSRGKDSLN